MKLLIALVAMALGGATTALIVSIQNDPFTLTTFDARESLPALSERETVQAALVSTGSVVHLEEITVVGRLPRPPARAAMSYLVPASAPAAEPAVVAAPCRDGEYQQLDAWRGVRLMCPGQSLK
jgi:hypothetical protein